MASYSPAAKKPGTAPSAASSSVDPLGPQPRMYRTFTAYRRERWIR
jgi:hypothetical protein